MKFIAAIALQCRKLASGRDIRSGILGGTGSAARQPV
jgi:hypothetical protein